MKQTSDLRSWTAGDSADLYHVNAWGCGYFGIDDRGDLCVHATDGDNRISLKSLVDDLQHRGYSLPLLLRFSDILKDRVRKIHGAFATAIAEEGYRGVYRPVFPIKVNQQSDVVEELVQCGGELGMGLEAGSKPELLVALALADNDESLIICNGYKDRTYLETALLAQKLGRHPVIVIDRFDELELVIQVSRELELRPHLGVRAKLAARGAGKWAESSGSRSKFGLTAAELVAAVDRLREAEMLDCLELLHFHIGSQITAIRAFKEAVREASRIFVELSALGAQLRFLDVGGGLGVDYDGSKTNFHSSTNYSLQEYATDVVYAIRDACDALEIAHPDIVSESGRALVAHHAVLVVNVLGTNPESDMPPVNDGQREADEDTPQPLVELRDTYRRLSTKSFQECYHDALQSLQDGMQLFNLGFMDLRSRAELEQLFWAICKKVLGIVRELDYVPDELQGLERAMADNYFCNFSVFQSLPDHWAVKQLFPVMPIHRLTEKPTRRAILSDLTCDSDGRVDRFIDLRDVKHALELHPLVAGQPYYLGVFLVGAYQEILGDLHNLFGDTNALHIRLEPEHGYRIERVVEGDTVNEVLGYVQYDRRDLVRRVRAAAEAAMRRGHIQVEETALLLRRYQEGLEGTTYLALPSTNGETGAPSTPGETAAVQQPSA